MDSSSEYEYESDYDDLEQKNIQTFYISRHLNSCNNMVDNIKWTNPSYKFSEPPLSMWGVISGLALQREPLGNFQNKVYVSCLVRTWMTAIIEYLPHATLQRNKGKSINLIVSPYIKESDLSNKYYVGQTIDKGNMPVSVDEQIEKIKYFFSFLILIQKYLEMMELKTTMEENIESYSSNILKIKNNLKQILLHKNEINIFFPSFKNKKQVKMSLEYDDFNKKLKSTINELYDDYSYFDEIPKDKDFSLELQSDFDKIQQGGDDDINYNYFENVLKAFLKQNLTNNPDKEIELPLNSKKIKINSTPKKSSYFNKIPKLSAYTTSFGKESILLFIDWIKNVIRDEDEDIYVVAHSNIMQATLYNICGKIKNTTIKKKNVNDCEEGLYDIVKKQNIWELILKVQNVKNNNFINYVNVRQGQEKPNNESENALNYNREKGLSCGKDIENIEKIIKRDEITRQDKISKHKIIVQQGIKQQGIKQPQPQLQYKLQQPEKTGLFGKFKKFFTRGKGGRYKKYTIKQNTRRTKTKTTTKRGKMRKNKNNLTRRRY
jgi:hypothetical protein